MKLEFLFNRQPVTLTLERAGDLWRVRLPDGSEREFTTRRLPDDLLEIRSEGKAIRTGIARIGTGTHVSFDGQLYVFEPSVAEGGGQTSQASTGELTSPMPGVVADVMVGVGDIVAAYQPVVAVEAMKVVATVEAPFAGRVTEVCAAKGERVGQGERLVVVTAGESEVE